MGDSKCQQLAKHPAHLHQALVQLLVKGREVIKGGRPALQPRHKKGRERHSQKDAFVQRLADQQAC